MDSKDTIFQATHSQRLPCECCGNNQFRPVLCREDGTLIVHCEHCHLEFVNPLPNSLAFQNLYRSEMVGEDPRDGYFSQYIFEREKRMKSFSKLYHSRLKFIESLMPNKGNLLDIGCGAGYFVKCAIDRGWTGHGLEMGWTRAGHGQDTGRTWTGHGQDMGNTWAGHGQDMDRTPT